MQEQTAHFLEGNYSTLAHSELNCFQIHSLSLIEGLNFHRFRSLTVVNCDGFI